MATTRGGLAPGQISKKGGAAPIIQFMFNPSEYSIHKANTFSPGQNTGKTVPKANYQSGNPRELSLTLWFDTYADGPSAEDVSGLTQPLFKLMDAVDQDGPPVIEFKWGGLTFVGVITDLRQKFTLFKADGTPVRTSVDISIKEKPDEATPDGEAASASAPTNNKPKIKKVVTMSADASLSSIAASATGDPANWKAVAVANNIEDPLNIPNGLPIQVPDVVNAVSQEVSTVTNTVSNNVEAAVNAAKSAANAANAAATSAVNAANSAVSAASGMVNNALSAVNQAISSATQTVNNAINSASQAANNAVNQANAAVASASDSVNNAVNAASAAANNAVNQANAAVNNASSMLNKANDAVNNAIKQVNSTVSAVSDAANTAIKTAGDAANSAVQTANSAVDSANSAVNKANDATDNATNAAGNAKKEASSLLDALTSIKPPKRPF